MDVPRSEWREVSLAGERAWVAAAGESLLLFGQGPAEQRVGPEQRLRAWLAGLDHGAVDGGSSDRPSGPAPGWSRSLSLCWGRQVHGSRIVEIGGRGPGDGGSSDFIESIGPGAAGCVGDCDGLITRRTGLGLVVWTADCVPVLLVGRGVVAAVHSGWRGCAAGIVAAAARRMIEGHGSPAEEMVAVIGPAVGPCHYPVGPDVVEALAAREIPRETWLEPAGRRVDLRALIRAELIRLGARPAAVHCVGGCTACSPVLASYRRDGDGAGRQWSMVLRRGNVLDGPLSTHGTGTGTATGERSDVEGSAAAVEQKG